MTESGFILRHKLKLLYSLCTPAAQITVNKFIFSWHGSPGSDVSLSNNSGECLGRHLAQLLE